MSTIAEASSYPVRVEARLDPDLSRWKWLVKWLLAIPHYIVLAFLWIAFGILSVIAFFAILITGRYPRSIFDFNVGVLRWTWRVSYYAYGALATDRYPPFSLEEDPDYPAHLEVAYPDHLSRGLVLVKWWLLAIPHYLIVALFAGGLWFGREAFQVGGGLISLLALVAGIMLAITAKYPQPVFDLVLGLNRWVLRVAAYAGLMTDEYPPFRFDLGGSEPGGTLTVPPTTPPGASQGAPPLPSTQPESSRWGAGRIIAVVLGSLLTLPSLAALAGGGTLLWADLSQRDDDGYLNTAAESFETSTYAVVSERLDLSDPPGWLSLHGTLGTVRLRVAPASSDESVFVGIARTADIEAYLAGVGHAVTTDLGDRSIARTVPGSSAPAVPPTRLGFWAASSIGVGERVVTWHAEKGRWSALAMNTDTGQGMAVRASIGATLPALRGIAIGLLAGGGFFLIVGVVVIIGAVTSRRGRE